MNSWWGIQTFKNQIRRLSYRRRRFLISHEHINTFCSICFQLNQLKIDSSHNHPLHPHHHCHHHHHQALSSACLSVTLCFFLNWCQIVISTFICGSSHLFFFYHKHIYLYVETVVFAFESTIELNTTLLCVVFFTIMSNSITLMLTSSLNLNKLVICKNLFCKLTIWENWFIHENPAF